MLPGAPSQLIVCVIPFVHMDGACCWDLSIRTVIQSKELSLPGLLLDGFMVARDMVETAGIVPFLYACMSILAPIAFGSSIYLH